MGYFSRQTRPEIFQGRKKTKPYFEGWFIKSVTADGQNSIAFIPGISYSGEESAFIQINSSFLQQPLYIEHELGKFSAGKKSFDVQIAGNRFSTDEITVDIHQENFQVKGHLTFHVLNPLKKTFLMPSIMGWFSYLPMQCFHHVISMSHKIEGSLEINGKTVDFSQGRGYIEKDWGKSFPKDYVWMQANHFTVTGTAFFGSIAHIPFFKASFYGFIVAFMHEGRTWLFTTYNGSTIVSKKTRTNGASHHFRKGSAELIVDFQSTGAKDLKAPVKQGMTRIIKESLEAVCTIRLLVDKKMLFQGSSPAAGFEAAGDLEKLNS